MRAATRKVEPTITLDAVKDDPKDNHILEAAIAARADCIVTGDKHLLRMAEYRGIEMILPAEFLNRQR